MGQVGRRCDTQESRRLLRSREEFSFPFGNFGQGPSASLIIGASGGCDLKTACCPLDQRNAKPLLQLCNLGAYGGGWHFEAAGGACETLCFHHFNKDLDAIHAHSSIMHPVG